jgi:hypothetical protein
MSDTTLIQRLRSLAGDCDTFACARACREAADALEQQAHAAKVASDMVEIRERVITYQKAIIRNQAAQIEALRADAERLRQLLSDARSALDYHQEQTRPIHSTRTALAAIDAALRQEQLKPPPGYTAEELEKDNPYNQWMQKL